MMPVKFFSPNFEPFYFLNFNEFKKKNIFKNVTKHLKTAKNNLRIEST